MNASRWLRSRILAALATAPMGAGLGCATAPEVAAPQEEVKKTVPSADGAKLCATWLQGRRNNWCSTPTRAKELMIKDAKLVGQCPDRLDPRTVTAKAKDFKHEGGKARSNNEVLLLREKTKTATADCEKDTCCYAWAPRGRDRGKMHIIRGRPLATADGWVVAAATHGGSWAGSVRCDLEHAELSDAEREQLAAHWQEAALMEHASVASFARASLELMAVGAPAELLNDVHRAAIDEIRHAERCFELARLFGARCLRPGPLPIPPMRPCALADVAETTFEEGCVAETIAALEAQVLASRARDLPIANVLSEIAEDEARHAQLAWRTLAWTLAQGDDATGERIRQRADEMYPQDLQIDASSDTNTLAQWGILDEKTRQELAIRGWTEIVHPTLRDLGVLS